MDLTKRRQEVIDEHKAMEKYDPFLKANAEKGDRLSDRPVAFLQDEEVVIIGECVGKVLDGLKLFVDRFGQDFIDPKRSLGKWQYEKHAFLKANVLLERCPTVPPELRVSQQVWNAIAHCLNEVGLKAVLTEGLVEG